MQDLELCRQLLLLDEDWSVAAIEIDEPSHRIDITIRFGAAKKKSLFKRAADDGEQETVSLRHLPLAGYRTYLHVPKAGSVASDKSWATAGSHFSHEMEAYIANALHQCRSVTTAAKLVGITPAEAREISERTGAGTDREEPVTATTAIPAADTGIEQISVRSYDLDDQSLPVETHPNWQRFINGEIPIQSNAVALQMLLQRVRQQIANNPTEVTRMSSARLLRQYFIKNRNQHPVEVAMLAGDEMSAPTLAGAQQVAHGGVPADTDPCWQRIIDGDLRIDTGEVGLQMMMERVRLSVERNPTQATRMAGAKLLRQYFAKHQARLPQELSQLGVRPQAAPAAAAGRQTTLSVPAEHHDNWLKLIEGDLTIDTSTVALQMMLERVRLSVERNPSEASRRAGIKILRQFFTKHQGRLQNEIAQLGGVSLPARQGVVSQLFSVPAETDMCWQSVIDGLTAFHTDNVALQMMLERVRLSVERNPSAANINAGIKLLRQFFLKHQARLQSELQQLGGRATSVTSSAAPAAQQPVSVPPESHPSWQRLIDGELEIRTDVVALKMMLERIRISISNNPSSASRLAGAKILRQYFLKHQNKHRAEIDQLLAA